VALPSIQLEAIPVVDLYFARNGMRYRSSAAPCSGAVPECARDDIDENHA